MRRDDRVVVLGEDVGKVGGVFRVTQGLWDEFGDDRVIDTPLSRGRHRRHAPSAWRSTASCPSPRSSSPTSSTPRTTRSSASSRSSASAPAASTRPRWSSARRSAAASAAGTTTRSRPSRSSSTSPGLKVVCPSNPYDAKGLLLASIRDPDPGALLRAEAHLPRREGRGARGRLHGAARQAAVVAKASDVTVLAWGAMLYEALAAADEGRRAGRRAPRSSICGRSGRVDIDTIVDEREEDGPRRRRARGAEDVRLRRRARRARQREGVPPPRGAARARDRLRHAVPVHARDGVPTARAPHPPAILERREALEARRRRDCPWALPGTSSREESSMARCVEFKLPDIGEGVTEGEIVTWLVHAGDVVTEDQPMVEVMTDKATVTITAPKAGKVVEPRGKVGDTVPVGSVLVVFELGGEPRSGGASRRRDVRRRAAGAAERTASHGSVARRAGLARRSAPAATRGRATCARRRCRACAPPARACAATRRTTTSTTSRSRRRRRASSRASSASICVAFAPTGPAGRVTRDDVERFARGARAGARQRPRPRSPTAPAPPRGARRADGAVAAASRARAGATSASPSAACASASSRTWRARSTRRRTSRSSTSAT